MDVFCAPCLSTLLPVLTQLTSRSRIVILACKVADSGLQQNLDQLDVVPILE